MERIFSAKHLDGKCYTNLHTNLPYELPPVLYKLTANHRPNDPGVIEAWAWICIGGSKMMCKE